MTEFKDTNGPNHKSTLLDDLAKEIRQRRVLFVLGAGVSVYSSNGAPVCSWKGLLSNGLNRIVELELCKPDTACRVKEQIQSEDLEELLGAATFVAKKLGCPDGGEFRRWISETIGSLVPEKPELIRAVAATGCNILTTNYDGLVEQVTGKSPVTWLDFDRCEQVLRGSDDPIVHIHGYWSRFESLILGQDAYALIASNERFQTFIRSAHVSKTFVYIGCGDGLGDPNFSQFFQWCEKVCGDSQVRRYRLCRDSEVAQLQQQHRPNQRIKVLPYGKDYSDIVEFMSRFRPSPHWEHFPASVTRRLSPNRAPKERFELRGIDWYEESDAPFLHGRAKDVETLKKLLVCNSVVRLAAPSGTGKSSLLRAGLVPALRKLGWRAIVVRAYGDPAVILPSEFTKALLEPTSPPFSAPFDHHAIQKQVMSLLEAENCPCLAVLVDQAEDVLSPAAAPNAKAWLREFLAEVHRCAETMPILKVIVSYRTDAEAELGRLWQEASGNSAGFAYHSLLGITEEDARTVIVETAEKLGWKIEADAAVLARELCTESAGVVGQRLVFPPYLQILLTSVQTAHHKSIDGTVVQKLGGIGGILGTYLHATVEQIKAKGGDFEHVPAVLQAVCRSSGEKLRATVSDISSYTGVPAHRVCILLDELVKKRLIRPLDADAYEIQHDRLAEIIVSRLDPKEREYKEATELLQSKAASFKKTKALLTQGEIALVYRHRNRIVLRGDAETLVVTSVIFHFKDGARPGLGWTWIKSRKIDEVIEILVMANVVVPSSVRRALVEAVSRSRELTIDFLIKVVAHDVCKLGDGALDSIANSGERLEFDDLQKLLESGDERLRRAGVVAVGVPADERVRNKIRELAKSDPNAEVQRLALCALGVPLNQSDITTLRHIGCRQSRGNQAKKAVELLCASIGNEAIRDRVIDAIARVAIEARNRGAKAEAYRFLLKHKHPSVSQKDAMRSREWQIRLVVAQETTSSAVLMELTNDTAESVRRIAMGRLAVLPPAMGGLDFLIQKAEAEPVHKREQTLNAIARNRDGIALRFLISIAQKDYPIPSDALRSIATVATPDAVDFLLCVLDASLKQHAVESERDGEYNFALTTEELPPIVCLAIRSIEDRAVKEKVRSWCEFSDLGVKLASIETYTRLSDPHERAWMYELVEASDERMLRCLLRALTGVPLKDPKPLIKRFTTVPDYYDQRFIGDSLAAFLSSQQRPEGIASLRTIAKKARGQLRAKALHCLARLGDNADSELFRELAHAEDNEDFAVAVEALSKYKDERSLNLLRDLVLGEGERAILAAAAFSVPKAGADIIGVLDECLGRGYYDTAAALDFRTHAPVWWPQ